MLILCDSREQRNKHVTDYFEKNGIQYLPRVSFETGDYREISNEKLIVDRKANLTEVCGNVCQQHERFRREVIRAHEAGIQLVILIEHGHGITSIEDVERWVNPRLKKNKTATSGGTLAKIMRTFSERYGVRWEFCRKEETGARIVEILGQKEKSNGIR